MQPRRQRGVAIVTVLLIVALVATLVASVAWREMVGVRTVENQRTRIGAMWLERGAVEWARLMLREQARASNVDYVGQAWSAPVGETRLRDLLPADTLSVNSDLADATISGEIEDAQSRFNLTTLVTRPQPNAPYELNMDGMQAYQRLLKALSLNESLASLTGAYLLRAADRSGNASGAPLPISSIADLIRIPGYDANTVRTLAAYADVLPDSTTVNANTASAEVLGAAIPGISTAVANSLVRHRSTTYYRNTVDVAAIVMGPNADTGLPSGSIVGVNSGYFIVHCKIHSTHVDLRVDALIARYGIGNFSWTSVVWVRPTV